MKISIYPDVESHPRSKEAKANAAQKVSKPGAAEVVEIRSDDDLIKFVTENAWSPFIFKSKRQMDDFVSCDFLVYDIDHGLTIDDVEAIIRLEKLCALCLPSPSHTPEQHRFRLILPLSGTIFDREVYSDTWSKGADLFPGVDTSCKDSARWYGGSTADDGFWLEGAFFSPVKKEVPTTAQNAMKEANAKAFRTVAVTDDIIATVTQIYGKPRKQIPEAVEYFLKNAHTGLPGLWICGLNAFCFSLSLSGVEESVIMSVTEQLAPNELDKRDLDQMRRAIKDGIKYREEKSSL